MSTLTPERVEARLREQFPNASFERQTGEAVRDYTIFVPVDQIVDICTFLRDDPEMDFGMLTWLGGVDHLPRDPRFEVVYSLLSITHNLRIHLKVRVSDENPRVPTVTGVWTTADWLSTGCNCWAASSGLM